MKNFNTEDEIKKVFINIGFTQIKYEEIKNNVLIKGIKFVNNGVRYNGT